MTAFPSYSIGTVTVGAGDAVIVGGGGAIWSETNALAGDDIVIAGHNVIVEDVIDTTHLQIDPWPYAAVPAGTPYKIVKRSPPCATAWGKWRRTYRDCSARSIPRG